MNERRRLIRLLITIAEVLIRHGASRAAWPLLPEEERRLRRKRADFENAKVLYRRILQSRGLMIKLGQFLSTRVDLLPWQYVRVLSRLQDRVPAVPYAKIRRRIRHEFRQPPERLFAEFDKEALASASLAQVHRATLYDGRAVAVKVLYPDVEKIIESDLRLIELILRMMARADRHFDYQVLIDEFKRYVTEETDLEHEAKNLRRMREAFATDEDVVFPEPIAERTTKGVLTTTFLEGVKITQKDELRRLGVPPAEAGQWVLDMYFRMIFQHRFFQADPHPGNIFVVPRGEGFAIGLVDFGLCHELPDTFARGMAKLGFSLVGRDPKQMASALQDMGFESSDGSAEGFESFCRFVLAHMDEALTGRPDRGRMMQILEELLEIARQRPLVRMPSHFVLIVRTFAILTGLSKQLGVTGQMETMIMQHVAGGSRAAD